jgi:hypothetical protein
MNSTLPQVHKLSMTAVALTMLSTLIFIATSPVTLQAQQAELAAQEGKAPATVPGMLPSFITAGNIDPNGKVPTLNGVPGSAVENLDLAFPVTVLTQGTRYVYSVVVQDYNYTGSCTVAFKLTQVQGTKTVTLDSGTITTFNTAPGNIWVWVTTGKAIPNSPGLATLTGSLKYGTTTTSTKTTVVLQ